MDNQTREIQAAEEETITDIQNYLASFNKEIQNGTSSSGGTAVFHQMSEGTHLVAALNEQSGVQPTTDGATTYYVTHSADGSGLQGYHYDPNSQVIVSDRSRELAALMSQDEAAHVHNVVSQQNTAEQQTIRMVVRQPDGTETEQTLPVSSSGGSTLVTSDGQEIHVSDEGTLQMMANLADQTSAGGGGDGNNQVLLNTGNSYQTVTIVPSDTNPGEVSYVLIVSQPDENKDDQKGLNMDMSVYDFNEVGEKYGEVVKEEASPDGSKMRTIRISPKKSQTVTQAHMCNYCNYTSPKRYLLSRHMKSHSEERPHKCSVCECGFKTLASLQNHVNTHTGTRPHHCKECDACFTTSGELVRHVRYRHTHEKPHRCTECDYASVELSKLKRHMRCHTGERPYQCPHCTYASPDTYKLKRHLRIHTGEKPYECEVCHARFTQSNSLKAHRMIHSGNKPMYQCEFCPTTCGRKTDLRIHVQKLHTSDKPLKCKRCGKSFPDRYSLKIHVKTHEGEKCFKCDLCSYASISQRHLESHMLIHTDQKPFHCDECDQSFRQKQLLKRHKNLYHDPNYIPPVPREKTHECAECGKAFRHKGNLIRHLAIHDPDATEAEKAEAMLIGQQNELNEDYDGEESYSESEERLMKPVPIDVEGTIQEGQQEGQQVVVFEVIQLPGGVDGTSDNSEQTLTELQHSSLSIPNNQRNSQENLTILQHVQSQEVQSSELVNNNSAPITQVPRESTTELIEEQSHSIMTLPPPPPTPRRRGRPRKYPLPTEIQPTQSPFAAVEPVQARGDGQENKKNQDVVVTRRRKADEYIEQTEPKRGRIQYEEADREQPEPKVPLVPTNPEDVARREEELIRKRQEQKQRDMAECFGFDDNEDEETILAMPAAPGTKGLQPVCL